MKKWKGLRLGIALATSLCGICQVTYGQGNGVNDYVYTLAADSSGNVYVGGDFDATGSGEAEAIAKWNVDSQTWTPLYEYPPPYNGDGVGGTVNSIAIGEDGNVYVGGEFGSSGGRTAMNVSEWEPSETNWNVTMYGVDDGFRPSSTYINGVATSGSEVYVVGNFPYVGADPDVTPNDGIHATNIAAWDFSNSTWSNVGSPPPVGIAKTIITPDGVNFYAGGNTVAHGVLSGGIIKWQVMDTNINGSIYAIAVTPSGQIFIGGDFASTFVRPAQEIGLAEWNGTNFVQYSDSADGNIVGTVWALAIYNGNLVAGGGFYIQQQFSPYYYLQNLAELDLSGNSWSSVLGGSENYPEGQVNALAIQDSDLFVGGEFTTVGNNVSASYIAAWNASTGWSALGN